MSLNRTVLAALAASTLSVSSANAAITVARTTTFSPGIVWTDFTYSWTITVAASKGPYNEYEVTSTAPQWKPSLDLGSFSGSGNIAGPQPAGGIRVSNPFSIPFTSPTSGSITTNSNPKFVAGKLDFQILFNGTPLNARVTTAFVPLIPNATTTTGSTMVAFSPGTFAPNTPIDLFQSTSLAGFDAHIGFGMTTATGSAMISLNRPLLSPETSELAIGLDGQIVSSIPAPGSAAVVFLGLSSLRRRRR